MPKDISDEDSEDDFLNLKKPTFIEVCAGCGGLSSGLMKAGFVPVLLNDNNKDCCKTLEKNHKKSNVICSSMLELNVSKFIGKIDLLAGGVPCQAFSQSGKREGLNDPRGDLILKFIELIDILKPKMFLIENVRGLLTHDNGNTIEKIITKLEECNNEGYTVKYKLLNAMNYGVPQKRERVFIIGILKKYNLKYKYPEKDDKIITLGEVLKDVPSSLGSTYSEEKKKLFEMIPQGGCWINLPIELQKSYLGKSFESGGGKRGILRRLSMSEPSLTLLCSPSQKQTERCHPTKTRPLKIREYARIQTFDDDYEFIGSISSQYKQIGNAVPVELARRVGITLYNIYMKMEKSS